MTMSINTTKKKTNYNFGKNEKFIDEKSQKTLAFHELSNTKNKGKIHHFPILEPKKKTRA